MKTKHPKTDGDPTPVTGGRGVSPRLVRKTAVIGNGDLSDPLDRHIMQLLSLHKDLGQGYGDTDLSRMDAAAKTALLDALNRALDIKSLN